MIIFVIVLDIVKPELTEGTFIVVSISVYVFVSVDIVLYEMVEISFPSTFVLDKVLTTVMTFVLVRELVLVTVLDSVKPDSIDGTCVLIFVSM